MKEETLNKLKKPLSIEEIDFRIQSINKGGYANCGASMKATQKSSKGIK